MVPTNWLRSPPPRVLVFPTKKRTYNIEIYTICVEIATLDRVPLADLFQHLCEDTEDEGPCRPVLVL
jgi:hypothetical protein